jgi:hypothetical protein
LSEKDLRDGLCLAVADEPPMTFDLDDLVIKAERLVRRRRALVAVGSGTAMVAVAAVAVPVVLGISPGGGSAVLPEAAPRTSVSVPAQPPTHQNPAGPNRQQLAARGTEMQTYLQGRFPEVVAGSTGVRPGLFGGEAEGALDDGQQYLSSFVNFVLGGNASAVEVHVQSAAADQSGMDRNCPGCVSKIQPDGSTVVIEPVESNDMKIVSATHFRNDGSVTRVSTYNYNPTGSDSNRYPNVVLSEAQLVVLATDPNLHF